MPVRKIEAQPYFAEFSRKENKAQCAIAMAMKIKGFQWALADEHFIVGSLLETGERYWWVTPKKVAEMIRHYDSTEEVYSVSFTLNTDKADIVRPRSTFKGSPKETKMSKRAEQQKLKRTREKGRFYRGTVPQSTQ